MKRIRFYVLFTIMTFLFNATLVNASGDGFMEITSEEEFDKCIQEQSSCRLMDNLTFTSSKTINKEIIIDLNGHSIVADSSLNLKSGFLVVDRGGKLTIDDSEGTGKISTGTGGNVWAAIQLLKNNADTDLAELIVDGGTIEGYYYGIVGNGNNHNTKVTINDGTIKGLNKEDSAAIYQPQIGEIIINNGNISGGTGIEIRSGKLTVNNGNIEAIATNFIRVASKSGTTTNGVAIAVAQHTTKNDIQVVINGGNMKGQYAFYEWNPHNHSSSDLNKIKLHIYGGNFTGEATGVQAVYSEDFIDFISGGKFNTDVSKYLTDDAKLTFKTSNDDVIHNKKNNKKIITPVVTTIIILLGLASGAFICKKKRVCK